MHYKRLQRHGDPETVLIGNTPMDERVIWGHRRRKLKSCEAAEVYRLYWANAPVTLTCAMFRINPGSLYSIVNRKSYKEIHDQ